MHMLRSVPDLLYLHLFAPLLLETTPSSQIWLCWLGSKLYQSTRLHSSSVSSMNQYSTTPSCLPRGWGSELRFPSFRCKHFPN